MESTLQKRFNFESNIYKNKKNKDLWICVSLTGNNNFIFLFIYFVFFPYLIFLFIDFNRMLFRKNKHIIMQFYILVPVTNISALNAIFIFLFQLIIYETQYMY